MALFARVVQALRSVFLCFAIPPMPTNSKSYLDRVQVSSMEAGTVTKSTGNAVACHRRPQRSLELGALKSDSKYPPPPINAHMWYV